MRRATQPDAVLAAADGGGYMLGARQYERKRPRPECLYQRTPFGGNRGSPIADIGFRRHMNDDGMIGWAALGLINARNGRSEEHTSELQSLMRNSYAVFCLKKKKQN